MRYAIEQVTEQGETIYILRDGVSSAEARLAPGIGNNLYSFRLGDAAVLLEPPSLDALRERPTRFGYPVLFPPNRTKNASFEFKGRKYSLPVNTPEGHHIHGELRGRSWSVTASGADEHEGAFVTSEFRMADHPDIIGYFPHALVFRLTYRLRDGELSLEGNVTNEGADEAPFAMGFHPYFRLPETRAEACVPAVEEWPVEGDFISGAPVPTACCESLRQGLSAAQIPATGYQMLRLSSNLPGDRFLTELRFRETGRTLQFEFDSLFPFLVVFIPPDFPAISFEPYSCVTDAFNVPEPYERSGARGIEAGETLRFVQRIRLT